MLNSAPVQLLPIDYGGSSKKISEQELPEVRGESFDDVLQSVKKDRPKSSDEKKAEKTAVEKEGSRDKKLSGSEEAEETAAAAQDIKSDEAAESRKKGGAKNSLKGIKGQPDGKSTLKTVSEEKNLKKVSEEAAKTAALTGAPASITAVSGEKSGKQSKAEKSSSKSEKAAVSGSKALAAKPAAAGHAAAEGSSLKPSIQLAAAVEETGKERKVLKKAGKLKTADHRQSVSASADKSFKLTSSPEGSSFKSEVDSAGRIIELGSAAENASDSSKTDVKMPQTRHMQTSLLSQLKDSVNSEIVKQAGIIVKGDGTGEIKLVMKPESLGKVRIQLSLNDNHIAGRIFVENNIVREIFESNLENLYKAFGSEGFETGSLEVSVQGQGGQADGKGRKNGRGFTARAVKAIDEAVPEVSDTEWRNNAVNMVV